MLAQVVGAASKPVFSIPGGPKAAEQPIGTEAADFLFLSCVCHPNGLPLLPAVPGLLLLAFLSAVPAVCVILPLSPLSIPLAVRS